MILGETLLRAIVVIFCVVVAAFGWLWNILIITVMIRNRMPVGRRHYLASIVPYGLSLHFAGVGIWLAILWYRDYHNGRHPDGPTWFPNHDLLERLEEL